ncbi:MAG: hypothetical protein II395_04340, partial [Ruminococcus sp.]|nr:hypothetical protein [Ruminococcus sp.]
EAEWKDVVTAMRDYIHSENLMGRPIAPLMTRTTDDNGVAVFASDENVKLLTGLYLVESVPRQYEEAHGPYEAEDTFEATPFIVRLPNFVGENHDGEHEIWNYEVVAAPKEVIYSGNSFWIHYKDNNQKIGGATVTGMPHLLDEQFHLDDTRLRYFANAEDVLQPYSKNSGASDSNAFVLDKNCDPQAEGYTFIGWNTDPDADEGYSTVAFSKTDRDYIVYAIWEKNNPDPPVTDPTDPTDPTNPTDPTDPTTEPTEPTEPTDDPNGILIGDVDMDGQITINDATTIQRHLAELTALTGDALIAADCDGDGRVAIKDVTLILKKNAEYTDEIGRVGRRVAR